MKSSLILAQAAGAWLQYEFACGRSELFNERYMSVPVSQAINAIYHQTVISEYVHPTLASTKEGKPGRRPEIDFVAIEEWPYVISAVETKWVGKNGISLSDILWDLMRLELIAHNEKADALFILAGKKKYLEKLFGGKNFTWDLTRGTKILNILKIKPGRGARVNISYPPSGRIDIVRQLVSPYKDVSFPNSLSTHSPAVYPTECQNYQYQVYVWQISSSNSVPRFCAKNHISYR